MKKDLRVIVCGGRSFANPTFQITTKEEFEQNKIKAEEDIKLLYSILDYFHETYGVVEMAAGAAIGADSAAETYAKESQIPFVKFPVTKEDWDTHGKKAGILRNIKMLEQFKPDIVIAFPGGNGTENMCQETKKRHVCLFKLTLDSR